MFNIHDFSVKFIELYHDLSKITNNISELEKKIISLYNEIPISIKNIKDNTLVSNSRFKELLNNINKDSFLNNIQDRSIQLINTNNGIYSFDYTINKNYFHQVFLQQINSNKILILVQELNNSDLNLHIDKLASQLLPIINNNNSIFTDILIFTNKWISKIIDTPNIELDFITQLEPFHQYSYINDSKNNYKISLSDIEKECIKKTIKENRPTIFNQNQIKEISKNKEVSDNNILCWLGIPILKAKKAQMILTVKNQDKTCFYSDIHFSFFNNLAVKLSDIYNIYKVKELALKTSSKLKHLQHLARICYWEMNLKSNAIYISPESIEVFNLGKSGSTIYEYDYIENFVIKEDLKKFREIKISKSKTLQKTEIRFKQTKTKNIFHTVIKYQLIKTDNNEILSGTVQDITNNVQNREELKRAKLKAEQSDILKSTFLSNMSHEIRTPMNAILGFSKLLERKDLPQAQKKEYHKHISENGQNLLNLIDDIIDVAKIESKQILINKSNCPINKILNEIKNNIDKRKEELNKNYIDIILKKGDQNPNLNTLTDPYRFKQILSTLLNNALTYIEKGKIEFGYTYKNSNTFLFYVKDTGPGIPSNKIKHIFERFGRITGNSVQNPLATGMGLSIAKHLVEEMGGKIKVKSQENIGTTFEFTLPYEQVRPNKSTKEKQTEAIYDFADLNILIVEDNIVNATLLRDLLINYESQIRVYTAINGKIALEIFAKEKIDIIIMDIWMPEMDGYETTKQIRTNFPNPKNQIPILALSAHAMEEERNECFRVGMNAFLPKPIVEKDLLAKLKKLTNRSIKKKKHIKNLDQREIPDFEFIDLKLLSDMYKGVNKSINNIVKLCYNNIPTQINQMHNLYNEKNWNALRILAHSVKSSFNYLGMDEAKVTAKVIETNCANEKDLKQLPKKIDSLINIWKKAEKEIKVYLKINDK